MSVVWQLAANSARITCPAWNATLDLQHPDRGLMLRLANSGGNLESSKASSPLQILAAKFGNEEPLVPAHIDAYVRGNDLIASYDAAGSQQIRVQIYWRCLTPAEFAPAAADQVLAAFDLIFSMNTSLLDSEPKSQVRSVFSSECAMLHLKPSASKKFHPEQIQLPVASTATEQGLVFTAANQATGCFMVRREACPFSYVEMVHPNDFYRSSIVASSLPSPSQRPPAETNRIAIEHNLFPLRLEKGVILKARVRSAVISRQQDEATVVAAYQQFLSTELPLTA
ncbi:MAG TPA: hypothetical protein VFE46_01405 [Pirellulales bacterium]|jgi:hypothetical protein|nr:hypothetical protein [Pirellulales bacterium]